MPLVKVNDIDLYYETNGSGLPILFVHPPLLTSRNFIYQQAQLSDAFRIVTFDIRGHGRSQSSAEPITYKLITSDLIALLDYLQIERCVVCGYSTGGTVALEAMLSFPQRFYGGILISAMPAVIDLQLKSYINLALCLSRQSTKKWLMHKITYSNSDTKHTFNRLYQDAVKGNIINIRQYFKQSYTYDCTDLLAQLHLPQLLVYGDKDTLFLRYALLLSESLPEYDIHLIKGARHQIPTKNYNSLHSVMRTWIEKKFLH